MPPSREPSSRNALTSLEATVAAARGGFACMFSTSDEYENALISERRAQGHYGQPRRNWPVALFLGCTLAMAAAVILLR
jgi:hypothetical protein